MIKGTGASSGIAFGRVFVKKEHRISIEKELITDCKREIARLYEAICVSKNQVEGLYIHTLDSVGEKEAEIFTAHKMLLEDPELLKQIEDRISSESVNAEWAVKTVTDYYIDMLKNIPDEYMRERAGDIKDVADRLVRALLCLDTDDLSNLEEGAVIVAEDLTPSDTAKMDKKKVVGFVTETGGKTSHSVIMARALGIPAVVGAAGITGAAKEGDFVLVDGDEGFIYLNPVKDIVDSYQRKKDEQDRYREILKEMAGAKSISKDGKEVELAANVGTSEEIDQALENGAEGIGLFRSEFLYMGREKLPLEEEQFEAYKKAAEGMKGKPVVIRTLDIGGDKELSYLKFPKEMNPFLGYRAIRLCLDRTDIFKVQIRAILRASAYGNIKIMFPMISCFEELREAKLILEEVKQELRGKNINFNEKIEVGMMIEIPAAAILSDLFAREVDFFSIGTNDLIQYTIAVDRMNEKISYLYNQYHPAILRLVKNVIDNGHNGGIWVGMCGEAASDPKLIPLFLGLGLDEFSMSPSSILKARQIIRNTSQKEMKELAEYVINLTTSEEVEKYLDLKANIMGN